MADPTDKKAVIIAAKVAVGRWRRGLDGDIGEFLDQADECLQEASLMNANLPTYMATQDYAWETVLPKEIKGANIKKVRQYAGLVLKKMHQPSVEAAEEVSHDHIQAAIAEGVIPAAPMAMANDLQPADPFEPTRALTTELFAIGGGHSRAAVQDLE